MAYLEFNRATSTELYIDIKGLTDSYSYDGRTVQWYISKDGLNFYGVTFNETIPKKTETFSGCIKGLEPNTTYYIFAHIGNIEGMPSGVEVYSEKGTELKCKTLESGGGGSSEGDTDYIPIIESFTADILDDGRITVSFTVSELLGVGESARFYDESEVILYCNDEEVEFWQKNKGNNDRVTITVKSYAFTPIGDGAFELRLKANNFRVDTITEKEYQGTAEKSTLLSAPVSRFSWTWAGIKRNDNGTYQVVKGKTKGENGAIYFYLTADEWNGFTGKINKVRASKGYSEYDSFTIVQSSGITGRNVATDADNLDDNQKVSADILNEAVDAINEMGTSIETVSSGDRIEVEFFNKLVNELNSIS